MKYIDSEKLKAGLEIIYDNMLKRTKIDKDNSDYWAGKADAYRNIIYTITSIQQDKEVLDLCSQVWWEDRGWIMIPPDATLKGIESLLERVKEKLQQEQLEVNLEEEITDKSRACCNCVNGILQYPNYFCWQHKYCNTDEPYKIPKEDWVETAKTCKEFELGLNARKDK